MYFNPQQGHRRILSPPISRCSASISPRITSESGPPQRSSNASYLQEIPNKGPFLQFPIDGRDKYSIQSATSSEHARNFHEQLRKQEASHRSEAARVTENTRMADLQASNRKLILSSSASPSSATIPAGFRTPHEVEKDRVSEFMAFNRHQSPRGDITPRAMYERERNSMQDENEQARLRERFMHGAPQPAMFTSLSPPPSSGHSSNLVLGRADGSILRKIPNNYDARTADGKR